MSKILFLVLIVSFLSFAAALKCSNCTDFGGSNADCLKGKKAATCSDGAVCYVAKAATNLTATQGKVPCYDKYKDIFNEGFWVGDKKLLIRGCGASNICLNNNLKTTLKSFNITKVENCKVCSKDNCNSSGFKLTAGILPVFLVFMFARN